MRVIVPILMLVHGREDSDDEDAITHGHITSLAVLRSHRKMGIATKLMKQAQRVMVGKYSAQHVSLHVRRSNRAALALYVETLGFTQYDIEKGYYADKEDAFAMRLKFVDDEEQKEDQKAVMKKRRTKRR
eukprot:TRINITY_DN3879_c0_g1_i2.p2 TRINITY_DN3879_c0_g1~~TRINITY_DN3879_c0_g1_i2.p2  ORF type:complete len:130 (+),score=48.56 TRINITY_DN3879_c0_g1_i2:455-844(+)